MNNTTNILLVLILGGAAAYFISSQDSSNQQQVTPQYPYWGHPNIPVEPQPNTPAWAAWANAIIGIAGNAISLWQPGGPFYNNPNVTNQGFDMTINPDDWI